MPSKRTAQSSGVGQPAEPKPAGQPTRKACFDSVLEQDSDPSQNLASASASGCGDPLPDTPSSGLGQAAASELAKSAPDVTEEVWQRCRIALESITREARGTPRQKHVEDLRDMLPKLHSGELPPKPERRQMARLFGVPQMVSGDMLDATTLVQNIRQAFVECVLERGCDLGSESGGEHLAIGQILQELRELGHWPRRRKNPKPGAEEAENKLRRKLCNHKLQEGDKRVLDALRESRNTSSGGAHPAANVPQSAASAAMQMPGTLSGKRLCRKSTVPNYGVQRASTPSSCLTTPPPGESRSSSQVDPHDSIGGFQSANASNRGIKRRIDVPDGLARKTRLHSSDDAHLAAEAVTDSMDGQADGALDIRVEKWYLPEHDFPIWDFVRRFGREPKETRKKDADAESKREWELAHYIRKHEAKLHSETITMLHNLADPGGCAARANADLMRLSSLAPDEPPHELVRCLKLIAGLPSIAALKKAKHNEDKSDSEIWGKAGMQLKCGYQDLASTPKCL